MPNPPGPLSLETNPSEKLVSSTGLCRKARPVDSRRDLPNLFDEEAANSFFSELACYHNVGDLNGLWCDLHRDHADNFADELRQQPARRNGGVTPLALEKIENCLVVGRLDRADEEFLAFHMAVI
jgi:hypothetical protein